MLSTTSAGIWERWIDGRPTDESLADALIGETIVVEKGWILDDKWTIEAGEVSGIKVVDVTPRSAAGIFSVMVKFQVFASGKGLTVEGTLRFRDLGNGSDEKVDFTPTKFNKIGNW